MSLCCWGTIALHGFIKIGASSAADGSLGDFQLEAIMNTEVMVILRQALCGHLFISLG